jgi:hypothetical protein
LILWRIAAIARIGLEVISAIDCPNEWIQYAAHVDGERNRNS